MSLTMQSNLNLYNIPGICKADFTQVWIDQIDEVNCKNFFRFRAGIKDLEVMMTNVISSAFDTVTTVEQGVELLDIFMHLSTREVIKIYAIVHLVTSIGGHYQM